MKDLVVGLLLGFSVGAISYFLVDGVLNKAAREASANQQEQTQVQLRVLQQMCPEVLQKAGVQKK